jgi:hypothetical protein
MTSTCIKRGTIVKNTIPLKTFTDKSIPVGTIGTVYKRKRTSDKPLVVGFQGFYTSFHLDLNQIETVNLNNQQVPKVGDIFYSSWGYEQTNIDFYRVEAVKNQTITLKQMSSTRTYTGPMCGETVPDTGNVTGEAKAYRLRYDVKGNPSVKLTSYSSAWKWDGTPKFFSEWH